MKIDIIFFLAKVNGYVLRALYKKASNIKKKMKMKLQETVNSIKLSDSSLIESQQQKPFLYLVLRLWWKGKKDISKSNLVKLKQSTVKW